MRLLLTISALGVVIVAGCRPNSQASQQTAADTQSLVKPPQLGEVAPQPATSDSGKATSPQRPSIQKTTATGLGTIPPKARRTDISGSAVLNVASFLNHALNAGERVQITGTCLDQFHADASAGPPPVSRSDWQLASGNQVVYVVGRMPAACVPGPATISATVAIDTTLIGGQRRPRRYLAIPRQ